MFRWFIIWVFLLILLGVVGKWEYHYAQQIIGVMP